MKKAKIAAVGGDLRIYFAANILADMGYDVFVFGNTLHTEPEGKAVISETLERALKDADLLLLPLPYSRDMIHLHAPLSTLPITLHELFSKTDEKTKIAAGMAENIPTRFEVFDYINDEEYTQRNALATAEGALATLIKETKVTVSGLAILLLGYGRIAKILARMLSFLGANVTVCARNPLDRVLAETENLKAISFDKLESAVQDTSVIINTVPYPVIDEAVVKNAPDDLLIIELASLPGGCNKKAVEERGLRLVNAPGLPGKYSPISAARACALYVQKIIEQNY